jgi:hypothetical protein
MREQELLQQVLSEIERLQTETQRLRHEANQHIDAHWHHRTENMSSQFETWRKTIGLKYFATYAFSKGRLTLLPELSENPASISSLFNISDTNLFEGNNASIDASILRQTRLALASSDLHFDFSKNLIFVPIVFADSPCGLVVAELFALEKSGYSKIAQETATFLNELRTGFRMAHDIRMPQPRAS